MKSEQINELAAALAKAQGELRPAPKDGVNPHLKNTYATLDSIIAALRQPLTGNGLSFSQPLQQGADGLMLETWLFHESGQFLQSEILVTPTTGNRGINEMQALGSTITYLKRYALAAMLGISVEEDDDGNKASAPPKPKREQKGEPALPSGTSKKNGRPLEPEAVKRFLHQKTTTDSNASPSQAQVGLVAGKLEECFAGDENARGARLTVLKWLWDVESAADLTKMQAQATLDWLLEGGEQDSSGDYPLHRAASEEARRVYRQAMIEAGQMEMEMD